MRARQSTLPGLRHPGPDYGGTSVWGARRRQRPFDPGKPLHVILKSGHARGDWSLLRTRHRKWLLDLVPTLGRKHHVRVISWVNVGNHLHLVLQTRTRENLQGFLKELPGRTAMRVTGARKGRPLDLPVVSGRRPAFWDQIAWSTVVQPGRQLRGVLAYLDRNRAQAGSRARDAFPEADVNADPPVPARILAWLAAPD